MPGEVRDRAAFDDALRAVRTHLSSRTLFVVREVQPVLQQRREVLGTLERITAPALAPAVADMRAQVESIAGPGFVTAAGLGRLRDLARYLRGVSVRIDRLGERPDRDRAQQEVVDGVEGAYADLLDVLDPLERDREDVRAIGWLVEELRVSLFAQSVGVPVPVSAKRVRSAIAAVRAELRPHG